MAAIGENSDSVRVRFDEVEKSTTFARCTWMDLML